MHILIIIHVCIWSYLKLYLFTFQFFYIEDSMIPLLILWKYDIIFVISEFSLFQLRL